MPSKKIPWEKLFDEFAEFLEVLRQVKEEKRPIPERWEAIKSYWRKLKDDERSTIEKKVKSIEQKLAGKTSEEKQKILQAALEDETQDNILLKNLLFLDSRFQQQIKMRITEHLELSKSIPMQLLLETLGKKLGCQGKAKEVAHALTAIYPDDAQEIRKRLRMFKSTVKDVVNKQLDIDDIPSYEWGQKVWKTFCALLLLNVDIRKVYERLAVDPTTEAPPTLEIIGNYSFTLAAVNGRHHQTFPKLECKNTTIQNKDEIPLNIEKKENILHSPPNAYGIDQAETKAMRSLLTQILNIIDTTPKTDGAEQVRDIDQAITTIQEILEDKQEEHVSYYLKIEKDHFTDSVWLQALRTVDQRLQSAMTIFSVINNAGKGATSGLLLFSDGACQQYINTMREQLARLPSGNS